MIALYIFLALFIIGISIWLFISLVNGLYEEDIIRVEEANISIKTILNKKIETLKKINDILKEINESDEDKFKIIDNFEELNNIELNKEINNEIDKLNKFIDENLELKNNEDYSNIEVELKKLDIDSKVLKQYYNDTAERYNKMINFTPYKLVARIKKYELLETFDNNENMAK